MPYRLIPFINEHYYHVFNRGVEKRKIFLDESDYKRFLQTLYYYQFSGPKPRFSTHKRFRLQDFNKNPKIVELTSYCLMPNHFHLLIKQIKNNGVQEIVRKVINSYTKYFNTRYKRVGHLFQGTFKAVPVETDEQLIHLSRYIHLNPYVDGLVKDVESFPYSSYFDLVREKENDFSNPRFILNFFKSIKDYQKFIEDHQSYALELEKIKHLLIEDV